MVTEGATIGEARSWVAEQLHFPVEEARLIAGGRKLRDDELLADVASLGLVDLYLVTQQPETGRSANVKIYVKDTTRVPHKMYAVKMGAFQKVNDLKTKLFEKSSCKLRPQQQLLTCRGRVVDNTFTLREYTISKRRDRIVFYLSKDPESLKDEELSLIVRAPSAKSRIELRMRADQTVDNLCQVLWNSYGVQRKHCCLLNAAGLVLEDKMTLREACTLPRVGAGGLLLAEDGVPPKTNLNLFMFPFPREKFTQGVTGLQVYVNPAHHAALGVTETPVDADTQHLVRERTTATTRLTNRRRPRSTAAVAATATAACSASHNSSKSAMKGFRGLFTKKSKKAAAAAAEEVPPPTDTANTKQKDRKSVV